MKSGISYLCGKRGKREKKEAEKDEERRRKKKRIQRISTGCCNLAASNDSTAYRTTIPMRDSREFRCETSDSKRDAPKDGRSWAGHEAYAIDDSGSQKTLGSYYEDERKLQPESRDIEGCNFPSYECCCINHCHDLWCRQHRHYHRQQQRRQEQLELQRRHCRHDGRRTSTSSRENIRRDRSSNDEEEEEDAVKGGFGKRRRRNRRRSRTPNGFAINYNGGLLGAGSKSGIKISVVSLNDLSANSETSFLSKDKFPSKDCGQSQPTKTHGRSTEQPRSIVRIHVARCRDHEPRKRARPKSSHELEESTKDPSRVAGAKSRADDEIVDDEEGETTRRTPVSAGKKSRPIDDDALEVSSSIYLVNFDVDPCVCRCSKLANEKEKQEEDVYGAVRTTSSKKCALSKSSLLVAIDGSIDELSRCEMKNCGSYVNAQDDFVVSTTSRPMSKTEGKRDEFEKAEHARRFYRVDVEQSDRLKDPSCVCPYCNLANDKERQEGGLYSAVRTPSSKKSALSKSSLLVEVDGSVDEYVGSCEDSKDDLVLSTKVEEKSEKSEEKSSKEAESGREARRIDEFPRREIGIVTAGCSIPADVARKSRQRDIEPLNFQWKKRVATRDVCSSRTHFRSTDFGSRRDHQSHERFTAPDCEDRTATDHRERSSRWDDFRTRKIWSQLQNACKNFVQLAVSNVNNVIRATSKSRHSSRNRNEDEAFDSYEDESCFEQRKNPANEGRHEKNPTVWNEFPATERRSRTLRRTDRSIADVATDPWKLNEVETVSRGLETALTFRTTPYRHRGSSRCRRCFPEAENLDSGRLCERREKLVEGEIRSGDFEEYEGEAVHQVTVRPWTTEEKPSRHLEPTRYSKARNSRTKRKNVDSLEVSSKRAANDATRRHQSTELKDSKTAKAGNFKTKADEDAGDDENSPTWPSESSMQFATILMYTKEDEKSEDIGVRTTAICQDLQLREANSNEFLTTLPGNFGKYKETVDEEILQPWKMKEPSKHPKARNRGGSDSDRSRTKRKIDDRLEVSGRRVQDATRRRESTVLEDSKPAKGATTTAKAANVESNADGDEGASASSKNKSSMRYSTTLSYTKEGRKTEDVAVQTIAIGQELWLSRGVREDARRSLSSLLGHASRETQTDSSQEEISRASGEEAKKKDSYIEKIPRETTPVDGGVDDGADVADKSAMPPVTRRTQAPRLTTPKDKKKSLASPRASTNGKDADAVAKKGDGIGSKVEDRLADRKTSDRKWIDRKPMDRRSIDGKPIEKKSIDVARNGSDETGHAVESVASTDEKDADAMKKTAPKMVGRVSDGKIGRSDASSKQTMDRKSIDVARSDSRRSEQTVDFSASTDGKDADAIAKKAPAKVRSRLINRRIEMIDATSKQPIESKAIDTKTMDWGQPGSYQTDNAKVDIVRQHEDALTIVNVPIQTSSTVLTHIMSEFLVGGKKQRILMSIKLQTETAQCEECDRKKDRKEWKDAAVQTTNSIMDTASIVATSTVEEPLGRSVEGTDVEAAKRKLEDTTASSAERSQEENGEEGDREREKLQEKEEEEEDEDTITSSSDSTDTKRRKDQIPATTVCSNYDVTMVHCTDKETCTSSDVEEDSLLAEARKSSVQRKDAVNSTNAVGGSGQRAAMRKGGKKNSVAPYRRRKA